jgi:hypothetical protein
VTFWRCFDSFEDLPVHCYREVLRLVPCLRYSALLHAFRFARNSETGILPYGEAQRWSQIEHGLSIQQS